MIFNFFSSSTFFRIDIKTNPFRFINMSFKDAYREFKTEIIDSRGGRQKTSEINLRPWNFPKEKNPRKVIKLNVCSLLMRNESDRNKLQNGDEGKRFLVKLDFLWYHLQTSLNRWWRLIKKKTLFCNFSTYNGAISEQFIFVSCNTNDEGNGLNESDFFPASRSCWAFLRVWWSIYENEFERFNFDGFYHSKLLHRTAQKNNASFKSTSIFSVTSTHWIA